MVIQLLRIFITHSQNSGKLKQAILHDKNRDDGTMVIRFNHTVLKCLLDMIHPLNLQKINEEIENAIMSLFIELCRDSETYREEFMKEFLPYMADRLDSIMIYTRYHRDYVSNPNTTKSLEINP